MPAKAGIHPQIVVLPQSDWLESTLRPRPHLEMDPGLRRDDTVVN